MTYSAPGRIKYRTNGSTVLTHGQPVSNNGAVGTAIKQKAVAFDASVAAQNQITASEEFAILTKGIVDVDTTKTAGAALAAATPGQQVWIDNSGGGTQNNLATASGAGLVKYGVVAETAAMTPSRGVPTGHVRVDLDAKDQF